MEHIVIPDISCPFPSLISPHLEQVREHTLEWAKRFGLIQEETTLHFYTTLNIAQGACRVHPRAGLEELCVICDWFCWGFFYDDQFDTGERKTERKFMHAVHDHLLALLQDSPGISPQGPVAQALSDIWQRVCQLTSSSWQKRFALHHDTFFASQRWEAENRLHQYVPDVYTYISKRRETGATPVCTDFIELAGHFEVPPQIYQSQSFQAVLQAAQNIVCWYNDVYSLQKERVSGEFHNLAMLMQQKQNISLQEALNQVGTLIATETRHFQELVQQFSTNTPSVEHLMLVYMTDLGNWIAGSLDWHREALRYAEAKYAKPSNYLREILPDV